MFQPLSLFSRNRNAPALAEPDPFLRLQHEMNRLFDTAFSGFPSAFAGANGWSEVTPRIDIRETDKALEIEAELPGVDEDDLDVQIANNTLTIRGVKRSEKREDRNGDFRYVERSYGAFARSIALPYEIDPDAIQAVFKNGVLSLTLPKPAEAARSARRIAVKRG